MPSPTTAARRRAARLALPLAALALAAGPAAAADPAGEALEIPAKVLAADYGAAGPACPGHGFSGTVLDGIKRASDDRPGLATDGRLCAAAELLLGWKTDDVPPSDVLLALARGVGLPGAPQQVMITTMTTDDPRTVARSLAGGLVEASGKATAPRYGVATKRASRGSTRVVLLYTDFPYTLQPLPRQLPLNGTATVAGTLLGAWEKAQVVVSEASGKASEPVAGEGKAFGAPVRCGDKPGRIFVEVRASLDGQPRRLVGLPIACGGEPLPASIPLGTETWPADPAGQARLIFDRINAERTAAGLAPLAWSPALAEVAQASTEDLADQQLKAASPGLPLADRLAKADIGSPLVLQNPGLSVSARRASEGFQESPVHRANLMNPTVNTGAVAVVQRTGADGAPAVFVNELFIQVLPVLDPVKVRGEVRTALVERRAAAKAAPVVADPFLEELAQTYAAAMAAAGGSLSDAKSDALTQGLARKYKKINLVPGAKADPLTFATEPTLLGDVGKGLGVGTARGAHPVLGKNAVYVVVITATKR